MMLAILAAQVGLAAQAIRSAFPGRLRMRRVSPHAVQPDFTSVYRDGVGLGRLSGDMPPVDATALFDRLTTFEQDLAGGQYASAAETAQRFQWEVLLARIQGALSPDIALLLIDEAQLLCEALWTYEPYEPYEADDTAEGSASRQQMSAHAHVSIVARA